MRDKNEDPTNKTLFNQDYLPPMGFVTYTSFCNAKNILKSQVSAQQTNKMQ